METVVAASRHQTGVMKHCHREKCWLIIVMEPKTGWKEQQRVVASDCSPQPSSVVLQ